MSAVLRIVDSGRREVQAGALGCYGASLAGAGVVCIRVITGKGCRVAGFWMEFESKITETC